MDPSTFSKIVQYCLRIIGVLRQWDWLRISRIFLNFTLGVTVIGCALWATYQWLLPPDQQARLQISEIFRNFMLGVAVIGGAWWAVYQWRLQRSYETALEIELVKKCAVYRNNLFVVFIDVSLKNVSRCKLAARAKNYANGSAQPVYEDELETIKHSVGLQLRSIRSDIENNLSLNWFNSTELLIPENIPSEINLLTDYEIESGERIEQMWIEPGETTHVGCAIILPAGHYLAKVTFVGAREFDDFWRRLFYIHVPELEK